MLGHRLILLAFAMLSASPALADVHAASDAFRAGHYDAAFDQAGAEPTADAHALRARALLAKAMSGEEEPPRQLLDKALGEAEAALAQEPRHAEGRLQKAIALSLILRPMPLNEARRTGYGDVSKSLAEAVIAQDPANHYAHGFLAVWHVEVVRRGGALGAMMMGASVKTAQHHYAEATRLAPDDIGLRWQWARALAALDAKKYRSEIEAELSVALAAVPASDMDRVMQVRSGILFDVLKAAPRPSETQALAQRMW